MLVCFKNDIEMINDETNARDNINIKNPINWQEKDSIKGTSERMVATQLTFFYSFNKEVLKAGVLEGRASQSVQPIMNPPPPILLTPTSPFKNFFICLNQFKLHRNYPFTYLNHK